MLFIFDFSTTFNYLYAYMFIYNLALYVIFSCIFQILTNNFKTTHSFNDLGAANVITKLLLISLLSMAGVPPFSGFFSKIFLFQLLCMTNFSLLYPFFFTILFLGLYFYTQNVRFLNASNNSNFIAIHEQNLRNVPLFFYLTFSIAFFLIFGFMFMEEVLLFVS